MKRLVIILASVACLAGCDHSDKGSNNYPPPSSGNPSGSNGTGSSPSGTGSNSTGASTGSWGPSGVGMPQQ